MTIGPSPARITRAIERHVRNSHAIGRLVLDGVVSRLSGTQATGNRVVHDFGRSQTEEDRDVEGRTQNLPLPESEWGLLSSGDVVTMIENLDIEAVRAVGNYEETHRRRRLVVEAVRRRLGE